MLRHTSYAIYRYRAGRHDASCPLGASYWCVVSFRVALGHFVRAWSFRLFVNSIEQSGSLYLLFTMPDWSDGCFDPGCARSANPGAQCNCNDFFNARGTRGNNLCSPLQMLSRDGVPVETAEAIYASMKADSESVMRGLRCISKAQNICNNYWQMPFA